MKNVKAYSIVILASMFASSVSAQGLAINTKSGNQVSSAYQDLDNIATYVDGSNGAGVVLTHKDGTQSTVASGEFENIVPSN